MNSHRHQPFCFAPLQALIAAGGLAVVALPGAAKASYQETDAVLPFSALGSAGSPINNVTGSQQAVGIIKLVNWQFPFFGQTYAEVTVSDQGFIALGDSSTNCHCDLTLSKSCSQEHQVCTTSGNSCGPDPDCCPGQTACFSPQTFTCGTTLGCCSACPASGPTGQTFGSGVIAPWWDLLTNSTGKPVSYRQGGLAGNHFLTIDFPQSPTQQNVDAGAAIVDYGFQVSLFENGATVMNWGNADNPNNDPNGGVFVGVYGGSGTNQLFTPTRFSNCMAPFAADAGRTSCTGSNFPTPQTAAVFGDSACSLVRLNPVVATPVIGADGSASLTVTLSVDNLGTAPVTGSFQAELYLLRHPLGIEALPGACSGETCLGMTSLQVNLSGLAPGQTFTSAPYTNIALPSPLPAPGDYLVEVALDRSNGSLCNNDPFLSVNSSGTIGVGQDVTGEFGPLPFSLQANSRPTLPFTFKNLGLVGVGLNPLNSGPHWTLSLRSTTPGSAPIPIDSSDTVNDPEGYPIGDTYIGQLGLGPLAAQPVNLTLAIPPDVPSGNYSLVMSIGDSVPNDVNLGNNTIASPNTVYIAGGISDFAVRQSDLIAPRNGVAGETLTVTRTISNVQGGGGSICPYGYFLNPSSVISKGNGIPIAILVPDAGARFINYTPPLGNYGSASGVDTESDTLLLPTGEVGGAYNLVLVVDPNRQTNELNTANDFAYSPVNIAPDPISIQSSTLMPAAIVKVPYSTQLQASGTPAGQTWQLIGGALPPGLTLSSAGLLSGTSTVAGIFNPVIEVSSGPAYQVAAFKLPVANGSGELAIEVFGPQFPSATVGRPYTNQLTAQGGVPPYVWSDGDANGNSLIPISLGLTLSSIGVLYGTPALVTLAPVQFAVTVTDALGTQATDFLSLSVVDSGDLQITTTELAVETVGQVFADSVLATDGADANPKLTWSLPPGTPLPTGVQFTQVASPAVAQLYGTPTEPGTFPVVFTVSDENQHTTSSQLLLTVVEAPVPVQAQHLPNAYLGADYAAQLASTATHSVVWRLFSGQVPPGLSLSSTGAITGTVDPTANLGTYAFAAVVGEATGEQSVLPASISVVGNNSKSGCSTGGGIGWPVAAFAAAGLLRRRRRERHAVGSPSAPSLALKRLACFLGLVVAAGLPGAARAQVSSCPSPLPKVGAIPFSDITALPSYQALAKPITADNYSSFYNGQACFCNDGNGGSTVPTPTAGLAGSFTLPINFGYAGIASNLEVNVWVNGLLTFNPSVSFDPTNIAGSNLSNCLQPNGGSKVRPTRAGYGSDFFGGLPFQQPGTDSQGQPNGPAPVFPNALIAPWWGDLSLCPSLGEAGWAVTEDIDGTAMAVIQWTNATASPSPAGCNGSCNNNCPVSACSDNTGIPFVPGTNPQFSFQVRLHAGTNDVDFIYGPSSGATDKCGAAADNIALPGSATPCDYVAGLQSDFIYPAGGPTSQIAFGTETLSCGSTCDQRSFPSGNSYTYHDPFRPMGPDIQIMALVPPASINPGTPAVVPVTFTNVGGSSSVAGAETVQFLFSNGPDFPTGQSPFSITPVPALTSCTSNTVPVTVTVPAPTDAGTAFNLGGGYLFAQVIAGAGSNEVDLSPKLASAATTVVSPTADLEIVPGSVVFSPPAVATGLDGGTKLGVSFTVTNLGQIASAATTFGIYLAQSNSVSLSDPQATFVPPVVNTVKALGPGQMLSLNATVQLDSSFASGRYAVGVIVDPNNLVPESNKQNDIGVAAKSLNVASTGVTILTAAALPPATVAGYYTVSLLAGGGSGVYGWTIPGALPDAGALPDGLQLSPSGVISGIPSTRAVGTATFTAQVVTGVSPQFTATRTFTLVVNPYTSALTVETASLPQGSTIQPYSFPLVAVGGESPYTWSLLPGLGTPPVGLNLQPDGQLLGTPRYDGQSSFQVQVQDAKGQTAQSALYYLTVITPGKLSVAAANLANAVAEAPYHDTFHARGGLPPYNWTVLQVNRLPASPGETETPLNGLPKGLQYSPMGPIAGQPQAIGAYALTVQVSDSATPPATATGVLILNVTSAGGLAFTTVQLPDAALGAAYGANIVTNAPDPTQVSFEVLNVDLSTKDVGKLFLPAGLDLYSNGKLAGVPAQGGTFTFLVQAIDLQGHRSVAAFSVTVGPALTSGGGGGCQTGAGDLAFAALAVALALFAVRRRTSPAH